MHNAKEWLLERQGLWLSLLCHLFLLLSFIVVWHPVSPIKPEPKPQMYIPSYSYQEPQTSISQRQPTPPIKTQTMPTSPDGLLSKPSTSQPVNASNSTTANPAKKQSKNSQGIHLIGDDKSAPKPLVKILARELSSHLVYPKIAADFKVHGTVYVGFTLHPDGSLTGVRLMQTSTASVLDQAALAAVSAMSPSGNEVAKYLKAEKFLVVGIIFGK